MRALRQPPNAAHTERAISKQAPPSLYKVPMNFTRAGAAPRAPGGARHRAGNRAVTSQQRAGQSMSYGDVKSAYGGAGRWDRRGCPKGAPRSANRQGEEQHKHTGRRSHATTRASTAYKEEGRSKAGEATRTGNQNGGDRRACAWEAATTKGMAWPASPVATGGVFRSPDGLFVQQEQEPTRGRPAVRGKGTHSGWLGQCVEEQGTWASRTRKHREAGYGRPVDRGAWTAKTVKRPRQQPAQPQYANYCAPLTCKRHTMPHPAQPRHTNHWALRTRKRHQQEHRPQRPTESSNPTQHVKGRTGDCPGPRNETTTRRNVTQGEDRVVVRWPGME